MKIGKYYTHEGFKDVYFYVLNITKKLKGIVIEVAWWNKGQTGTPYPLGETSKLFMTYEKANEFKELDVEK